MKHSTHRCVCYAKFAANNFWLLAPIMDWGCKRQCWRQQQQSRKKIAEKNNNGAKKSTQQQHQEPKVQRKHIIWTIHHESMKNETRKRNKLNNTKKVSSPITTCYALAKMHKRNLVGAHTTPHQIDDNNYKQTIRDHDTPLRSSFDNLPLFSRYSVSHSLQLPHAFYVSGFVSCHDSVSTRLSSDTLAKIWFLYL